MEKSDVISTEEILLVMCRSVSKVLSAATNSQVNYSPMAQKIKKTCLKPDVGCFVLFDGGFSGLVVINFTAQAAMDIYRAYMCNMGMPEEELVTRYTSDEVANSLGELMNQIVGEFTTQISTELLTSINQNQPKMLAINKELNVSIDTNLDRPQARRVTFYTQNYSVFFLELAMDKTQFFRLHDFEKQKNLDPDAIIHELSNSSAKKPPEKPAQQPEDAADLLDELGI